VCKENVVLNRSQTHKFVTDINFNNDQTTRTIFISKQDVHMHILEPNCDAIKH